MASSQNEYIYHLISKMLDSLVEEKKKLPKNQKKYKNFNVKINLGLQIDKEAFEWFNLTFNDGLHNLEKGKLETNYDLTLKVAPEDLLFFCNGENSVLHMLLKKNKYGKRKLRFSKGTTGRNLFKLLKLSKLIVLDKNRPD